MKASTRVCMYAGRADLLPRHVSNLIILKSMEKINYPTNGITCMAISFFQSRIFILLACFLIVHHFHYYKYMRQAHL